MAAADLHIRGACEHNLQRINLTLPRGELICFTGVSGSGKSSLAFDTLFAEGQRRYVESLSTYARHLLGQMPKPEVDLISNLSPAIAISQKTTGQNPRSTVGTITEIYDYLRILYARVGTGHCPKCGDRISAQTRDQILDRLATLPQGAKFMVLAPVVVGQKGEHRDLFEDLLKQGFARARVDGEIVSLTSPPSLDRQMRHDIEVVIDRLTVTGRNRSRLAEAVEQALKTGEGSLLVAPYESDWPKEIADGPLASALGSDGEIRMSADYACARCGLSFDPPSPQLFSFNSPRGMCPTCDGLGEIYTFDEEKLIPDPSRSFQQGCIELIGPWRKLGRWKRHIYAGVGATLERQWELPVGTVLETAWEDLEPRIRNSLLWGTGDMHVTYTWRGGSSGHKWGGKYEGVIPKLLSSYKSSKNRMMRRQLEKYMDMIGCGACGGMRLNPQACAVMLRSSSPQFSDNGNGHSLPEVCDLPISDAIEFFSHLELDEVSRVVAEDALKEIVGRLGFLGNVGLDYLTLSRKSPTLSGGEMQRIRLAGQIGCGLVDVLYILDEPSIGLHPRDNNRLLHTLSELRDQGNTVVVVEHDEDTMRQADHIVDFGPGPGIRGGHVVATGTIDDVTGKSSSLTGQYLSGEREIPIRESRRDATDRPRLTIRGATHNNLKNIDVDIPLGLFICVTGVSGSGKSSLVGDILVELLRRDLNGGIGHPGDHQAIEGLENLDKMVSINQSPIGRTPRSNPATYTKLWDEIRKLYSMLPESRTRGYKPGRFSFNVAGGRCEACQGNGSNKLDMDFLADIWVTCPVCDGRRFNRETLQVRFRGRSIAQALEMDVQEALEHFENVPKIAERLQTLHDVGLDYIKLGQPSPTLSGGEAQRVKLARELVKKSTGRTLYLLDEPTTGLHFADVEMLLTVLHDLVDRGNTVLVVEHNMDVVKTADWIIDLGPEGGAEGGNLVAAGTPEDVARCEQSHTGRALAPHLLRHGRIDEAEAPAAEPVKKTPATKKKKSKGAARSIKVRGARQHNLRDVSVEIPRDEVTVLCGPSGSGKTSLAMDTIYAEGQRRYVESLSSYARQFVGQMQKPKVDHIDGLSPAVAIEQHRSGGTPRSTVGTITEIYDYLRILAARLGVPYCPDCQIPIGAQSVDEIIGKIMDEPSGTRLLLAAPLEVHVGEDYESLWESVRADGFVRVRIDGTTYSIDDVPQIDRRARHEVELVVDRITVRAGARSRIADSVETAISLGRGVVHVLHPHKGVPENEWPLTTHSRHFACRECGRSFEPLTPHHFSFNSAIGWCPACEGLGMQRGTGPELLVRNGNLSLAEGALRVWPEADNPMLAVIADAFSRGSGVPVDVPFDRLSGVHRRMVLHGTGARMFDAKALDDSGQPTGETMFSFQYKGIYPALDEARRFSPSLRSRLDHLVDEVECTVCCGSRLRDDASAVRINDQTVDQLCRLPLGRLAEWLDEWKLDGTDRKVAGEIFREVRDRVRFLVDVGLDYLSLGRPAPTLSGGEMQRIRLAAQVGSGLCGVLYVLDEPTIGLHARDNKRLISALEKLRDLGNTLMVVEHDREVIAQADNVLDFGPRAGHAGGQIVARGEPSVIEKRRSSVTGPYLSGKKSIGVPINRRMESRLESAAARKKRAAAADGNGKSAGSPGWSAQLGDQCNGWIRVVGAAQHNLKGIDVDIPLGVLSVVTGVSGSGKSSLVNDILFRSLSKTLHRASTTPGAHETIRGIEYINKVIRVDQNPLGQTPASNPATYTGAFQLIRDLFANLPESKLRGYAARRFSFNVPGGRCEKCEGMGRLCIEMHFLPDVWIQCDACGGQRYNSETLAVRYRGRSIADVLDTSCGDALKLFENIPKIRRILQTLCDVGLDYLTLGQPAPTLSGGEAQRVKLAAELARPDTGKTLYLLDEPTTGLHFDDLAKLLDMLNRLVDLGNSVVIIEHNLDVIKTADWIIDLGPEAGDDGGQVVVAGTPEDVVLYEKRRRRMAKKKREQTHVSYTGDVLRPVLEAGPMVERKVYDFQADLVIKADDLEIEEIGQDARMPWEQNGRRWHTVDRLARNGQPCRWDGRILGDVVDMIQQHEDLFSPTDWSNRSVVEIAGQVKSHGWFFHAITGEPWLLKMKFRVPRGTFRREELITRLDLKPLNEIDDIPLYGTEPRTRCQQVRGPWQEIEVRPHSYAEIDRPEFWEMIDMAVEGFRRFAKAAQEGETILQPWRQLGQKWHISRRGFAIGRPAVWPEELIQRVVELIEQAAPEAEFQWKNKVTVPVALPGYDGHWAFMHTKKSEHLVLMLLARKGEITQGRIRRIGHQPVVDTSYPHVDTAKLYFRSMKDLNEKRLLELLKEHRKTALRE